LRSATAKGSKILLGYARTSTVLQEISIEAQKESLASMGCEKVFVDRGVSGGKFANRVALTKLLDEARAGDVVCVTKLDRFGRSTRGILELVDELTKRGISLKSMDGVDTSIDSPMGTMMLQIFSAFAELERSLIRSRTKEALASKFPAGRPRGLRGGRPPALTTKQHELVRREYTAGSTAKSLAEALGVSEATIWRSLTKTAKLVQDEIETAVR
jgi:DNA invertase Pin-like site-specific DNA recombinase